MGMLNRIVVCDANMQPIKIAPESNAFNFFQDDQKKFKETILPSFPLDISSDQISYFEIEREYFYARKMQDSNVVIVSSKNKLEIKELAHLFVNISHVQQGRLRQSLNDIVINPIGFIGRDLYTNKILEDVQELKNIMMEVINKVLERGEKIEILGAKTTELVQLSDTFKKKSSELNRCWC